MILNTSRILHVANFCLWLANAAVWTLFAHSTLMGVMSIVAAVGSLYMADHS